MKVMSILAMALFVVMLLISCDPGDYRLTFDNKTDKNVIVRICFIDGNKIFMTWAGFSQISIKERKVIGILGSWESEYKQVDPIQKMHVIVFENSLDLAAPPEQSTEIKSDSLLRIGDYIYKTYSYKELVSKNWKIVYPDDGFEDGVPLDVK